MQPLHPCNRRTEDNIRPRGVKKNLYEVQRLQDNNRWSADLGRKKILTGGQKRMGADITGTGTRASSTGTRTRASSQIASLAGMAMAARNRRLCGRCGRDQVPARRV